MPANQSHIKSDMSISIYCKPCLVKPPLKGLPVDGQAPSMSRHLHVAMPYSKTQLVRPPGRRQEHRNKAKQP